MRLDRLAYNEYVGSERAWTLEETALLRTNLIVGKNSAGKSRVLSVIASFSNIIAKRFPGLPQEGQFHALFSDDVYAAEVTLHFSGGAVHSERLTVDGEEKLSREADGSGWIWAEEIGQRLSFKLPNNEIALVSRRDEVQHKFMEPIHEWANSVRLYPFGTDMGRNMVFGWPVRNGAPLTEAQLAEPPTTNQVVQQYSAGYMKFGDKFDKLILEDLERVGYLCTEIGNDAPEPERFAGFQQAFVMGHTIPVALFVQEADLPGRTWQLEMSQGMFRALAVIIHLNYNFLQERFSTFLIDDVGEGLDFDRSSKLISLLLEKAGTSNQLIMTTNDRFIMNAVGIEFWQIVDRTRTTVRMVSHASNPKDFDDFRFLGLSNFDFFQSEAYKGGVDF